MINSPLPNVKGVKPVITQGFGLNPALYKPFGLKGHEGIDLRAPIGTPVFAPMDGYVEVKDAGPYGLHVIITNDHLKVILAHLQKTSLKDGTRIRLGEPIGLSGQSGNSKAPHLHMTAIKIEKGFEVNRDNGFLGGFDITPYTQCWEGTLNS